MSKESDIKFLKWIDRLILDDSEDDQKEKVYPNVPDVTDVKTIDGVRHVTIEKSKLKQEIN